MNIYKVVIALIILIFLGNMIKNGIDNEVTRFKENRKVFSLQKAYKLEPMEQQTIEYLRQNKYTMKDKKIVFYVKYDNSEKKEFTNIFHKYKNSDAWNKKYIFVEYTIRQNTNKSARNEKLESFSQTCGTFCIFDLNTNTGYSERSADTKKFHEALYAFYNL